MSGKGRLEKSLDYLHWRHVAGAILDVFDENAARHRAGQSPLKADADVWAIVDELRRDVHQRAVKHWCRRSGKAAFYWPYSEDGTARLYFRFRKRNEGEVAAFRTEIEAAGGGRQQGLFSDPDDDP